MSRNKPFVLQLIIVGGFLVFLYIFFALATSVYRDFKLETGIQGFEDEIARLAELAKRKPQDVHYYQSGEYKDKYAKENLNLLNPGEKLIIIPQEKQNVKLEVVTERFSYSNVLELPNRNQWWEYFFGQTLSMQTKQRDKQSSEPSLNPKERSMIDAEG